MLNQFFERICLASFALAFMLTISNFLPQAQGEAKALRPASDLTLSRKSLPEILAQVLPGVKAKTQIPVLLPSTLGQPIAKARYAIIGTAEKTRYTISLYYKLGVGDAGFAASFAAESEPKYQLHKLPNVRAVTLAQGFHGFIRVVSCGGSCAPANIWWEQNGIVYHIQIKLPPSLSEQSQTKNLVNLADSSIIGGAR